MAKEFGMGVFPGRRAAAALLALAIPWACGGIRAAQNTPHRTVTLEGRAEVTLTGNWTRRTDLDLPPLAELASSAPQLSFTDLMALEDRAKPAVLQIGYSSNPFFGQDATQLDREIHEAFLPDFFYLFFPPPRPCLASAKAAFEQALFKQDQEQRAKGEEAAKNTSPAEREPITLAQACKFGLSPMDFYSWQLSPTIAFRGASGAERVEPRIPTFYLAPMEQRELNGETFFIFEARADHALELADIQRFGLADDLQGARAHFFWAIGANTPFPFIRDPQRKDLQIFHVAFATLGFDGEARDAFRAILLTARFTP